jgi:hypothetical protein
MSDVDRSPASVEPTEELTADALSRLLRDPRRRTTLAYLLARREAVTLEELSAQVAGQGGTPSEQRVARVSIDLHHVHLPTLADAGIVRYDPESEVVEPLDIPEAVEAALDGLREGEDGAPAGDD